MNNIENDILKNTINEIVKYKVEPFIYDTFLLNSKKYDRWMPIKILFEKKDKDKQTTCRSIDLIIGTEVLITLPFFLIEDNKQEYKKEVYVDSYELLLNELNFDGVYPKLLNTQVVQLRVNDTENVRRAYVVNQYIIQANTSHVHQQQCLYEPLFDIVTPNDKKTMNTYEITACINGFCIYTEAKIHKIRVCLNNVTIFESSGMLVDLVVKKLKTNHYYVPLNRETVIYNLNTHTSLNCVNNMITIEIVSDTIIKKLGIYILTLNGFEYNQMRLYKLLNNKFTKIPLEYKEYKKELCPITRTCINKLDMYMICNTCDYGYHLKDIKQWLKDNRVCPMCRSEWTDFNTYVNQ